MNINIKKLTPELIKDYVDFFDNRAFTDNREWSACYCVFFHWNDKLDKSLHAPGVDIHEHNRNLASDFIRKGILQGYLAYVDGVVVGWCNANDKTGYESLEFDKQPEIWCDVDIDKRIKAVTCYVIDPKLRRKGIATKLLERVCKDAETNGYDMVEAYPAKIEKDIHMNYHGPFPLYEKCGFDLFKELEKKYIVRKYLYNE